MRNFLPLFFLIPMLSLGQIQIGSDIDGLPLDFLGASLKLSADGNTLAIGAPSNSTSSGRALVFQNEGGTWVQIGDAVAGEATSDGFGNEVDISANGTILAVGAPFNDGNGMSSGHVRIFENIGNVWTQIGEDIDGEAASDLSGGALSLSGNGDFIAIGATGNDGGGSGSGHVRVFENQGGTWIQVGQDINGETFSTAAGNAVSLSADGTVVAVGASFDDGAGVNAGQVRLFENQGGTWVQIGQDLFGNGASDRFGESVSLSADGLTVAIGAQFNDEGGEDAGSVTVFENLNGSSWVQVGQTLLGPVANARLGSSVSLSSQGSILATGLPFDSSTNNAGRTFVYRNDGGVWNQLGEAISGEGEGDLSGLRVSLASDTNQLAIGAQLNLDGGEDAGHVRVFDLTAVLSTEDFDSTAFEVFVNNQENFIEIGLNDSSQILEKVDVFNLSGQYLFSSKETKFTTEGLTTGVYIVQIETTIGRSARKVIIN